MTARYSTVGLEESQAAIANIISLAAVRRARAETPPETPPERLDLPANAPTTTEQVGGRSGTIAG